MASLSGRMKLESFQQGFVNSPADVSLFIMKTDQVLTLVLVYVDDIIITGNSNAYITDLISLLSKKFVMKDLGPLSYFLGIEVLRTGPAVCANPN